MLTSLPPSRSRVARRRQEAAASWARPLEALVVSGVLAGVFAAGLGVTGLAPVWAVLVGVAVGLGTPTPVLPGISLLAGAALGWGAVALRGELGAELALVTGAVVGGFVIVAVLAAHFATGRFAVWPVVLGGGSTFVTAEATGAPAATDLLAVLAGLVAGVAAVLVSDAIGAWRQRAPSRPVEDGEPVEAAPADAAWGLARVEEGDDLDPAAVEAQDQERGDKR